MYAAVAVRNHKGLQATRLTGLGHINIICGRNNSGKTTVLEALAKSGNGCVTSPVTLLDDIKEFGRQGVPARLYERVWPAALQKIQEWNTQHGGAFAESELKVMVEAIKEAIEEAINNNAELKSNQPFANALKQDANELRKSLLTAMSNIYKNTFQAVLIPARRRLDSEAPFSLPPTLSPSGEGLLPHLFFCRNQRKGSAERTYYESVRQAFFEVSQGYQFDLSVTNSEVISIDFQSDQIQARPGSDCGLGLHEALVIIAVTMWGDYTAVCIEEPESHIHPDMQRRLLGMLRNLVSKQFFISTHSNVFVNSSVANRVLFTRYENDMVYIDDVTSRATILHDLGYSVTDNLVSDLVLLVEGPTDVPIIEEFLDKLGLSTRYDIKIWPLGGDIMDQLDLSILAAQYKLLALVDLDPGSGGVRRRFYKNCERFGIEQFRLQRYSIENYFTLDALRQVFGSQIPSSVTEVAPSVALKDQIGINVKKNNRKIAQVMKFEDIEHTDLGTFFFRVRDLLTDI